MTALDPQLKALMRNTVKWERFAGQDGHADPVFDPPRYLRCWIEGRSQGNIITQRGVSETVVDPQVDVYVDAEEIDEKKITYRDRFTYTLNGQSYNSEPDKISMFYGPDSRAWAIVVTL